MDITRYIRELILLNECVILRGVGGFETSYKHASFRKNNRSISPPNKRIRFRPEMVKDNGVLENYIQKTTGISREKAANNIDDFVVRFFNDLQESEKVLLEGIGEFLLDENGKIKFNELEDVNYLADSFGLETLEITKDFKKQEISHEETLTPVVPLRRKLTGWYITAGVLLLVILITLVILISDATDSKLFSFFTRKSDSVESGVVVFGPQSDIKNDSLVMAIEKTINEKTSPKTALAIDTKQAPKIVAVKETKQAVQLQESYFLIAGSFKNQRNAEIMKEQLLRKGFTPEILYAGNFYRVVIGKFSDRQAAVDELRRIRKMIEQSVWLWERN